MDTDSIFIKHTEQTNSNGGAHANAQTIQYTPSGTLSKKDIISSIPSDCLKSRDIDLLKTKTEWRWRIFKFPNKENDVIEISYKSPHEKRKYINKTGDWVERNIGEEFDIYVIDEFYHYTDIPVDKNI